MTDWYIEPNLWLANLCVFFSGVTLLFIVVQQDWGVVIVTFPLSVFCGIGSTAYGTVVEKTESFKGENSPGWHI